MPAITAALVKELRDETGLPMMDCKKALEEAGGDKDAATQKLRESGKKLMSIRADRATEEGRIAVYTSVNGKVGAMIELQCESAPVANNDEFKQLASDLAQQLATGPGASTPDELWDQPSPSKKGKKLRDVKDDLENKIREVFRLSRIVRVDAPAGGFVHGAKIGVLIEVDGGSDELAKEVALHVAAMCEFMAARTGITEQDYVQLRADARRPGQGRVRAECFRAMRENDLRGKLSQIKVPTLALWGMEDNTVPLRDASVIADEMSDVDLRVIPNAGHWPQFETPVVTQRYVRGFLGAPIKLLEFFDDETGTG